MAHFAPVAPIQVLEQLYDHDPEVFGEYHLLLAHHTVEHLDRFDRLFQRIYSDRKIRPLIIMDNSVVECGGFVDFDMMLAATQAVSPYADCVPVLPDVMGDGRKTREATLEAYSKWASEIPCIGFMAVCQGVDFADYSESLQLFSNRARFPAIEYLGIPRFLVHLIGTRKHAVEAALVYRNYQAVHLLGYSDDMQDDLECSQMPGVQGIDSAVPLRVEGKFSFDMSTGPRPEDWFEQANVNPQMLANLGFARQQHKLENSQAIRRPMQA